MPAIDRRQGRWPESARNLERALELDPNNVFILQQISSSYECLREYPKDVVVVIASSSSNQMTSTRELAARCWKFSGKQTRSHCMNWSKRSHVKTSLPPLILLQFVFSWH